MAVPVDDGHGEDEEVAAGAETAADATAATAVEAQVLDAVADAASPLHARPAPPQPSPPLPRSELRLQGPAPAQSLVGAAPSSSPKLREERVAQAHAHAPAAPM